MRNKELFYEYANDILNHELFLKGKEFVSHGAISIYTHSVNVAQLAFSLVEDKKNFDIKCVVRAALLHDFFLYEWHDPQRYLMHGWRHAGVAAKNAREIFSITDKEYSCIKTHMWPWTLFRPPLCREGWVISLADKIIALKETVLQRNNTTD
jgi:uncharacterized protein